MQSQSPKIFDLTANKKCPFSFFSRCNRNCALFIEQPFNIMKTDEDGHLIPDEDGAPTVEQHVHRGCALVINSKSNCDAAGSMSAVANLLMKNLEEMSRISVKAASMVIERDAVPPHLQTAE